MFNNHTEYMLLFIILLPAVGALIAFIMGLKNEDLRNRFDTFVSIAVFVLVCYLYKFVKLGNITFDIPFVMGTGLYLKVDMLRYIMLFITALAFLLAQVFSLRYLLYHKNRNRYYLFYMLTLSSTLGLFMSDNVLNLFTFFEIMTVTSYFLVIHDEDEYTHKAGNIYIAMSLAGGLVQLMGIFLLYNYTGALLLSDIAIPFQALGTVKYVIAGLVITGFGVKACMFPLHIWLPKVYSPTPSPATAVFSGVLTKTGIFGIYLVLDSLAFDQPLSLFLVIVGLINMLLGGFLALHHRNIKKVLAYSSMSQIGYIFLGIGLIGLLQGHTTMAYYGSVFHMLNHALTKVLLFFGTGIVFMTTQKLSLNEIRGFGRNKPLYRVLFLIGTLGTIGIPGFNGYASKTMIHHAIIEASHFYNPLLVRGVEAAYYLASAFTVAYLLKLYVTIFLEENPEYNGQHKKHITGHTIIPMVTVASLIIFIGLFPNHILNLMGISSVEGFHGIEFFNLENFIPTIIIVILGIAIYLFYVIGKLKVLVGDEYIFVNPTHNWFDLEKHFYKPVLLFIYKYAKLIIEVFDNILVISIRGFTKIIRYIFSIEFYKDVSYYKRIANYLISLKYKTLKMNTVHHVVEPLEHIDDIKSKVEENNGKINKDLLDYLEDVRDRSEDNSKRINNDLLDYLESIRDTLDDKDEKINKDFIGYIDSIRLKIENNTTVLLENSKTTSRSMGFILGSVLGKLSSITYSIIIFALILAGLLVVMVAS